MGFSKNSICWKFSTCAVWVHILFLKYTFLWGPYMVLTHSKISASYIKWKCKSRGRKNQYKKIWGNFHAFHVEKSKILAKNLLCWKCLVNIFVRSHTNFSPFLGSPINFLVTFVILRSFWHDPNVKCAIWGILWDI